MMFVGKIQIDERNEMENIEEDDDAYLDQWNIPLSQLVLEKQKAETVQNILECII